MGLSKAYCNKSLTGIRQVSACVVVAFILSVPATVAAGDSQQVSHPRGHGEAGHHENPWSSVWKWANFFILFGGLGYYLRKPMREFFESRTRSIEEGLRGASEARETALKRIREIESRMANLDLEIRELKAEALREADEEKARIIESAKAEASKILEMGLREIEGLKKSAQLELKGHVSELAIALAEERLKGIVGSAENKKVIQDFIETLQTAKN
jgi:F-type H+-transporting ATPase subunit b